MNDKKKSQLQYFIAHGWPIFPVAWMDGDKCACGKPDCHSPGKHPMVSGGFYDATTDLEIVNGWNKQWPEANWAMRTGDRDGAGIVVVDIDNKSGGFATWDMLHDEHPEPVETVTVNTGGGGLHFWFVHPPGVDIRNGTGVLGPGIDIRANNGYVVIPPSKTVQPYKFEINPDDAPIAPLPDWIFDSLNGRVKAEAAPKASIPAAERVSSGVGQGERHQSMVEVAGAMRRVGLDPDIIQATLQAVRDERFSGGDHPVTDDEIAGVVEWIRDKDGEYAFTDLGNAERFLRDHEADVRYCFAWEKWLVWDGKRWVVDDMSELIRRAHKTVRDIYVEASNAKSDEKRQAIAAHAIRSEARSRIENMLHQARPYVAVKPDELDGHPMLLNVANGVVDLVTSELLPHDRGYMLTKLIDVEFQPDAKCPNFTTFVDLITGNDWELASFLQKTVGYTLTGRTSEHCLFFLHGSGQNGKTTFTEVVRLLMGDYAQRIDIEALMQNWNLGTAASPHVAAMAGARFVLASEIAESRKINESLTKDLTGGDSMTARFLFSNPFTFSPTHKLWIFGNHKPKVSGTDWGFWRRMRVIPFNVTIPEEIKQPMDEVLATFKEELPGILAWAVNGCLFWQDSRLEMVESVKTATSEYRTEQDLVQQFIDERCMMHPEHQVKKDELYTAWRNWCEDNGEEQARRKGKKWLTRQLTDRGFQHGGDGNLYLIGIKLA